MRYQPNRKKRYCYYLLLIFSGLVTAQSVATIQVAGSNAVLHTKIEMLHQAGYVEVPNIHVLQDLEKFSSAFNGGLFFTLTSGFAITVLVLLLAWIWRNLFHSSKKMLAGFLLFWLFAIFHINQNGYSSLPTLYLFLIPGILFPLFCRLLPAEHTPAWSRIGLHALLFILFIIGCGSQIKTEHFLDIRDFLLLNTAAGRRLNAFYYDNSLYSANYFKSNSQKLLKTCSIYPIDEPAIQKKIQSILSVFDYLPIREPSQTDLTIRLKQDKIQFLASQKMILILPLNDFLNHPAAGIQQFEKQTDNNAIFRKGTMYSLLFVSAVCLYGLFFIIPFNVFRLLLPPAWSIVPPATICCAVFFILFLSHSQAETYSTDSLKTALRSSNLRERVRALRYISRSSQDVLSIPGLLKSLPHREIPERYWIARALSKSHHPKSGRLLLQLFQDNHFNVVCMAAYAMGRRGERKSIPYLLQTVRTSPNWYIQWYAYKSLRKLGWRQKRSH